MPTKLRKTLGRLHSLASVVKSVFASKTSQKSTHGTFYRQTFGGSQAQTVSLHLVKFIQMPDKKSGPNEFQILSLCDRMVAMGRREQLGSANQNRLSDLDQLFHRSPIEGPFRPAILGVGVVAIHLTYATEAIVALAGKGYEPPEELERTPRNAFLP